MPQTLSLTHLSARSASLSITHATITYRNILVVPMFSAWVLSGRGSLKWWHNYLQCWFVWIGMRGQWWCCLVCVFLVASKLIPFGLARSQESGIYADNNRWNRDLDSPRRRNFPVRLSPEQVIPLCTRDRRQEVANEMIIMPTMELMGHPLFQHSLSCWKLS